MISPISMLCQRLEDRCILHFAIRTYAPFRPLGCRYADASGFAAGKTLAAPPLSSRSISFFASRCHGRVFAYSRRTSLIAAAYMPPADDFLRGAPRMRDMSFSLKISPIPDVLSSYANCIGKMAATITQAGSRDDARDGPQNNVNNGLADRWPWLISCAFII